MGREDRFELRMMSAIDPQKLTVSNIEILCHMTRVTLIIIGGIVTAHQKRDDTMDCTVGVTYGIDYWPPSMERYDRKRTWSLRRYA